MHMCSIGAGHSSFYSLGVNTKGEQSDSAKRRAISAVSRWRDHVLKIKGWTAQQWADKAGVSATTITRSMAPVHSSTAKLETLHLLARAAGVPSVVDFMEGRAVSGIALRPLLSELMQLAPKGRWTEQDVEHLAEALEYGLGLPPSDLATPASPDAYKTAARAAASRFRELGGQA